MNLDPEVRQKLLKESKNPFLGLRRIIWICLFGSASIGLAIMLLRALARETVLIGDVGIQFFACCVFGCLILFDKKEND